jgi:hypothetical protein
MTHIQINRTRKYKIKGFNRFNQIDQIRVNLYNFILIH